MITVASLYTIRLINELHLYHNSHEWYNDQFMNTLSFSITIFRLTFPMGERIARNKNSLSVNICTHALNQTTHTHIPDSVDCYDDGLDTLWCWKPSTHVDM